MLDPTEQRILGVLLEKQLAVPDSYPMTENAVLTGCNQKNNRDPVMDLEAFQVAGALTALRLSEWVVRIEGGRAHRYRHRVDERLGVGPHEKAVLAELLLRGPQAPGALKPRVARMGYDATPQEIEALLAELRERPGDPLVEQLPRAPRERDSRWRHCLGVAAEPVLHAEAAPRTAQAAPAPVDPGHADLEQRIAELESELGGLREEVRELRSMLERRLGSALGE